MSDGFAAWVPSFGKPVAQESQRGLVSLTDRAQECAELAVLGMVTIELAFKTGRVTHLASPAVILLPCEQSTLDSECLPTAPACPSEVLHRDGREAAGELQE